MGATVLKQRAAKVSHTSGKTAMSRDRHAAIKAPVVSVSEVKVSSVEGGADIFAGNFPKGLIVEDQPSTNIHWYTSSDVNSKRITNTYNGFNLAEAARLGDTKQVKSLLDHSADPNGSRGSEQATPLQCAAYHGHLDVMTLLLNRGASVSINHGSIGTALHAAALHGTPAACLLLLSHGAPLEMPIQCGRLADLTPLQVAAFGHNDATLKLLLDHGASCADLSAHMVSIGMFCDWADLSTDFQGLIIADIIADASRLYIDIVEAAKWDAPEAVSSFLSSSSSSTANNNSKHTADLMTSTDAALGRTPLHWAATASSSLATLRVMLNHPTVTPALVAHVLRIKDRLGHTPMVLVCTYSQDLDGIRELRRAAVDAAKSVATGENGETPAGGGGGGGGGGTVRAETELWGKVLLAEKFLSMSF